MATTVTIQMTCGKGYVNGLRVCDVPYTLTVVPGTQLKIKPKSKYIKVSLTNNADVALSFVSSRTTFQIPVGEAVTLKMCKKRLFVVNPITPPPPPTTPVE